MLTIKNLTKKYGDFVAVDDLNLEVHSGELFGFLGPNGAGKTTTIKVMTSLLRPTKGTALIGGFDITKEPIEAKRIIGYLPEEPFLYEKLTGREFLDFVCDLWQMDEKKKQENIEKHLNLFGLKDVADDLIQSYSHGMKQKTALAQALVHDPKVLILDEPLTAFDPKSARIAKDLLKDFAKEGGTVFLSTHILDVAEKLCTRVGIINKGKLIASGTLEELREKSGQDESLEDIFLKLTEEKLEVEKV